MASTIQKPVCLHIPPLYEEGTALLSWEALEGVEGYELDQVYDETFGEAAKGKMWADLACTWQEANDTLTWAEFEDLPAQGYTWGAVNAEGLNWEAVEAADYSWQRFSLLPDKRTVFKGPGTILPGPDQGLTWADLDGEPATWADAGEVTWLDISLIPSRGLNWDQIHSDEHSWGGVEDADISWSAIALLPARGLSWDSLNARCGTWQDLQDADIPWHNLERDFVDDYTHLAHRVEIQLYKKKSQYRIRAYDTGGDFSEHLTSGLLKHLPRSLKKYRPPCLHIPAVREGRNADIVWGDLYGAQGFVLERSLGGGAWEIIYAGEGIPVADPANKQNCPILSKIGDVRTHHHFVDTIPYYEKTVRYRVKAFNTTDASRYIESAVTEIIPVFYRDDSTTVSGTAGRLVVGQVNAQAVQDFENIVVTMSYPAAVLEKRADDARGLFGVRLQQSASRGAATQIVSEGAGSLGLRSTNTSKPRWTGLVAAPLFKGKTNASGKLILH